MFVTMFVFKHYIGKQINYDLFDTDDCFCNFFDIIFIIIYPITILIPLLLGFAKLLKIIYKKL